MSVISTVNTTHIPYNLYNTLLDASLRYLYPHSHKRSIVSLESLYKKTQEQDQIAPDSHPTDLVTLTSQDLTPTVPSAQNCPVAITDNHQKDSESENKVLNKPLIKKAVSETYYSRN